MATKAGLEVDVTTRPGPPQMALLGAGLAAGLTCVLLAAAALGWLFAPRRAPAAASPAPAATTPAPAPPTRPPATAPAPTEPASPSPPPSPLPTLPLALTTLPDPPAGQIVYTCFDGQDDELCLLDLANRTVRQLTDNAVGDWYASLTPDGGAVLFSRQVRGANYEIFRLARTGADEVQLTANGAQNYAPELSPDGTRIVFTSSQSGVQQI
ncbi:MAG: PD40 domain-containing protein, partial [Anaerolineales bacterium]|nr:PD40 domain-containing protein [Anaerolineales bacterium]